MVKVRARVPRKSKLARNPFHTRLLLVWPEEWCRADQFCFPETQETLIVTEADPIRMEEPVVARQGPAVPGAPAAAEL